LPALEIPEIKGKIKQGDEIAIDIAKFTAYNLVSGQTFQARPVPTFMRQMVIEGGLVEYYRKYGKFPWID